MRKNRGLYRAFRGVLVLGDGRAERVDIRHSEYRRQEVGFASSAIMHARIHCPCEMFPEGSYTVELSLGDLASKRTETTMVGRSERA